MVPNDIFPDLDPDLNFFDNMFPPSNEFTIDQFNSFLKNGKIGKSHLKIMGYNIRSFYRHIDEFTSLLQTANYLPDIIILSETWLTNENKEYAILNGYQSKHVIREIGCSGGISVFYANELNIEVLNELCLCNSSIECCAMKLTMHAKVYYIVGIYRPHSGTAETFTAELVEIFTKIPNFIQQNIILLGDFNINLLETSRIPTQVLCNFMRANYLSPVINRATRYSPNPSINPSLLDHIWVNFMGNCFNSGLILADHTDHCPIFINISSLTSNETLTKVHFRDYSDNCVNEFRNELILVNWNFDRFANLNEQMQSFDATIDRLFQKCFPKRTKLVGNSHLHKPWITPAILKSIKTKSNYFKLYRQGIITRNVNDAYKKKLTKVIKSAKKQYFFNYFNSCRNDVKRSWKGIKTLIGNNSNDNGKKLHIKNTDGELVSDEREISNIFNDYFSTIAQRLNDQIPQLNNGNYVNPINQNMNSMYLYPVTTNECSNIITNLKNSYYGMNKMSSIILKKVKDILVHPLTQLINYSFSTGVFPDALKIACVTPVYKSGDKTDKNNYRPISVIPLFGKIAEKCMYTRLSTFFKKFSILSVHQFGFRQKKSCFDAISSVTEYIYQALNQEKFVISLFIDLKKAYDTVNHEILLGKLYSYGIRGVVLKWFTCYLNNRIQRVKIGNFFSDYRSMSIGVPQGSVLGSLLFLAYINDLPNVSSILHSVLFADDTCFVLSGINSSNLIESFNRELEKVGRWLIGNRLSLNFTKTVAINFSKRKSVISNIKIENHDICFVDCTKYLGVFIDRNLTFTRHIDHICNKISKSIGVMFRISPSTPEFILLRLYYTLVQPYMFYCNVVWGGGADVHINKILILQKRAVRVVTHSDYLEHTGHLFQNLRLLKIHSIYNYSCSLFVYKNKHIYESVNNRYGTRNCNTLQVHFQRISLCQRSIFYNAPRIFNELPYQITSSLNLNSFKRKLKDFLY